MARIVEDSFLYTVADPEFYEPLGRYAPMEEHFIAPVRRLLPAGWETGRTGIWFNCHPPRARFPAQGWKIHVSATLLNAAPVLSTVARVLVEEGVSFKFAIDKPMLFLLNFKRWPRGGAGKFITVYPAGPDECRRLLERLHAATLGFDGPYILSDRRFRDGIVYYRYGGLLPTRQMDETGVPTLVIQGEDGATVSDDRLPVFRLPAGVSDPFVEQEPPPAGEGFTLKDGRYRIDSAVAFSNTGGVYVGHDTRTDAKVLIKEARPFTNTSNHGTDAVWLLKKEHRLLSVLEDAKVAPRPLDFFREWEHYYLVEEFIEGAALRFFVLSQTPALRTRATPAETARAYARYQRVFLAAAEALKVLHDRGIVFGDVSLLNVLVMDEEGTQVRFIDFEGAYEDGVDPPTLIYTPGFSPEEVRTEGRVWMDDDLFALGSLMIAGILPVNGVAALAPDAYEAFLRAFQRDLGLPPELAELIRRLMHPVRADRIRISEAIQVLRTAPRHGPAEVTTAETDGEDLERLLRRMMAYIHASATPEREDRLFPPAPLLFATNPLSVAFGACGVAYAMQRVEGEAPRWVIDWILDRRITPNEVPAGLYVGTAGIAWSLLELGERGRAEELLDASHDHPALWNGPDLFYGAAGWGMANLRFFQATGDERWLRRADEAGRFLLRTREAQDGQACWPVRDVRSCGVGHGAAGVALFLLYLYLATGSRAYLRAGRMGLEYVLARGVRNPDGGLTWVIEEGDPTNTPYWRWGSGGVGSVLLRYEAVLRDPRYAAAVDDILPDVDRKYSIFPGRFTGMAGVADFWLDLAQHRPGARAAALRGARKALCGSLLFKLERPGGVAFPGEMRDRISCDFGTGNAGIALALHRLLRGGDAPFMLDELIAQRLPARRVPAVGASR